MFQKKKKKKKEKVDCFLNLNSNALKRYCSKTVITFFKNFGVCMLLVIALSFIFAFLFVGCALAILSPTQIWSFRYWYRRFVQKQSHEEIAKSGPAGSSSSIAGSANGDDGSNELESFGDDDSEQIRADAEQESESDSNDGGAAAAGESTSESRPAASSSSTASKDGAENLEPRTKTTKKKKKKKKKKKIDE